MANLLVPQYVVFTLDPSYQHWVPLIIDYNGSPYMLVGATLEEVHQTWASENRVDEFPAKDFRVVDLLGGGLYQLKENLAGFTEILFADHLPDPDLRWFDHN